MKVDPVKVHQVHPQQLTIAKEQIAIANTLLHELRNTRLIHNLLMEKIHEDLVALRQRNARSH